MLSRPLDTPYTPQHRTKHHRLPRIRHAPGFDKRARALLTACSALLTQCRVQRQPRLRLTQPERVAVARPGIPRRCCHHTGPHRVEVHVPGQCVQMRLGFDEHALKAAVQEMPRPLGASIAMRRRRVVPPLESTAEVALGGLDCSMGVMRHHARAVTDHPPALRRRVQLWEKDCAIFFVEQDSLPGHTP